MTLAHDDRKAIAMCGRYVSATPPERLAKQFAVERVQLPGHEHAARYNVAPTTGVYAIAHQDDARMLGRMRWGFVPRWAKEVGGRGQPINARMETVADNRMFASSWRTRRCLIPADAYYEWQDPGDGAAKQPFAIADPTGVPLALAGIWTVWRPPDGPEGTRVVSTAILTADAHGDLASIHHRMPVILPERLWETWLEADEHEAPYLHETVLALPAPRLRATPVSTRVNNVRNDGPELIEPLAA